MIEQTCSYRGNIDRIQNLKLPAGELDPELGCESTPVRDWSNDSVRRKRNKQHKIEYYVPLLKRIASTNLNQARTLIA